MQAGCNPCPGSSLHSLRRAVDEVIGQGQHTADGHIPLSGEAKEALKLALVAALGFARSHVGTEHILLGLIDEGHSAAGGVLARLGASSEIARDQIRILLAGAADGRAHPGRRAN